MPQIPSPARPTPPPRLSVSPAPDCAEVDLRDYTGFLLRRAHMKAAGEARACLPDDAHVREVLMLSVLAAQGAVSQQHLSDTTAVHPTLMVKLIDSLEQKSWVVRERNPTDRRSYALRLTPAGRSALEELQQELDRADVQLIAGLSAHEVGRLKEQLRRLAVDAPAVELASLSDHVGHLIACAHRAMRAQAEATLRPLGLHPRDFGVLMLLGRHEPCSQRFVASRLGISSPAVLGFLDELAGAGLVRRTRNREDRRSYDLKLTAKGRRTLGAAAELTAEMQADTVLRLGTAGDAELRSLLSKLVDTS